MTQDTRHKTQVVTVNDIDVFITTHNRSKWLQESIDSILNQTVNVKNITVLDNESTDNTAAVVATYKNRGVNYLKTFGFMGNYKKAKELMNKKYVILFHDDDILHPSYFEMALKVINKYNNIALVATRLLEFKNNDRPKFKENISPIHYHFKTQTDFALNMYFMERIAYASAIFKTEYYLKEDIEYEKYTKFNDWPLMVKITKYGESCLFCDPHLMLTRRHDSQDGYSNINNPNVDQVINWDKIFYEAFAKNKNSKYHYFYINYCQHFLKTRFDLYLKPKNPDLSYQDFLNIARAKGLTIDEEHCLDINFRKKRDYFLVDLKYKDRVESL